MSTYQHYQKHLTCMILNLLQIKLCPFSLNNIRKSLVLFYKCFQLSVFQVLCRIILPGPLRLNGACGHCWSMSCEQTLFWAGAFNCWFMPFQSSHSPCHNDQPHSTEQSFCNPGSQREVNTQNGYVTWMKNRSLVF